MAHRTYNIETLKFDKETNRFYLSLVAKYKDRGLEVLRNWEDGNVEWRNIRYAGMGGGYLVAYPNESFRSNYYGDEGTIDLEEWHNTKKCRLTNSEKINMSVNECNIDKDLILEHLPNAKYMLEKSTIPICYLLELLHNFREYPEVEILASSNQFELAINKSFLRMKKADRKAIIDFVKNNSDIPNMKLNVIKKAIKNHISYYEAREMGILSDVKTYRWLKKQQELLDHYSINTTMKLYRDYKRLVVRAGHNINDEYWIFPKDLGKAHNQLMTELINIREAEEKARLNAKQEKYFKSVQKVLKSSKINGYDVYVPESVEDIKEQADALDQCLIRCDYISNVISKKSLLVFIKRDDKRIGTFEVGKNKRILQAYTDERDRSNCYFSDELMNVAKTFLKSFNCKSFFTGKTANA
jgi:hypothetical protein